MAVSVSVPPRPPFGRPARLRPRRRVALGVLLVGLAGAAAVSWALGARGATPRSPASLESPSVAPRPSVRRSVQSTSAAHAFTARVGDTPGCQTLAAAEPQLLCPLPGGVVTYTQVADPRAAYERVPHVLDGSTPSDARACAAGQSEERAWAWPQTPQQVAGRYLCRAGTTAAEMWWTVDDAGILGHAVRRDGDLPALFSWWRARREHP
jgi:hypothetical protein